MRELHTDRVAPGMEGAKVHLILDGSFSGDVFEVFASIQTPLWCNCVVDLRVNAFTREHTATYLAAVLNQRLELCLCLQLFHFTGEPSKNQGQAKIALGGGYSGQLKDLRLRDICSRKVDLASSTCLTSISLMMCDVDSHRMSCKLVLPSSVERFEFYGNSLFTMHANLNLQGLSNLTELALGPREPAGFYSIRQQEVSTSACMPVLPSSLRHLRVQFMLTPCLVPWTRNVIG